MARLRALGSTGPGMMRGRHLKEEPMATSQSTHIADEAIHNAPPQTATTANHNNVAKPVMLEAEPITTDSTLSKSEKPKPAQLTQARTDKAPATIAKISTQHASEKSHKKPDAILALIGRVKGANMAQLQEATGWQRHSIRAAISGLRQRGITIIRAQSKDGSHYSVVKA